MPHIQNLKRPESPGRRTLLKAGSLIFLLGAKEIAWGASVMAIRVWPSEDYSRITIESDQALKVEHQLIKGPARLAVDIKGLKLNTSLNNLDEKVLPQDPNIGNIRVGQHDPETVRLVIDLKQEIKPQVFSLKPVADYQHRLVFDLYPSNPPDPLQELIAGISKDMQSPGGSISSALAGKSDDELGDLIAKQIERANPPASADRQVAQAPRPPQPPSAPSRPAQPRPKPPAASPVSKTDRLIVVAIDPGHGGEDPGAIGPGGTYEKNVVLQIALKLRDRINQTSINGNPMRAFMTRDADFFVPLATRVQKARRVNADLFISIHADAAENPKANGSGVYALSQRGASSTTARWLASNENASDLIGGVNVNGKNAHVQHALLDMSTSAQIRDSLQLGNAVLGHIGQVGRLHKKSVERANFAVLRNPDTPSILVETAFITNPVEEKKLRSAAHQNALVEAILNGVKKYFAANPPQARNRQV